MPTLTISTTYADDAVLTKAQLDEIKNGIETFLNTTLIDSDNIAPGGVAASNLAAGAVTATKLGTSAVETAKINDLAVTTAKIAANAVTGAKLNSDTVDNSTLQYSSSQLSIKDLGVTTAKLAAGSVTRAKLESVGQQISASCGAYSTSSASYVDVSNLTVTITTTGRPVYLALQSDGSGNNARMTASPGLFTYRFMRDATEVSQHGIFNAGAIMAHIDTPAAGTYVYKLQAKSTSGSGGIEYYKLIAFEL
jgi:hypothetical protein